MLLFCVNGLSCCVVAPLLEVLLYPLQIRDIFGVWRLEYQFRL